MGYIAEKILHFHTAEQETILTCQCMLKVSEMTTRWLEAVNHFGSKPYLQSHHRWSLSVKNLVYCTGYDHYTIIQIKEFSQVSASWGMNMFLMNLQIRCFISF